MFFTRLISICTKTTTIKIVALLVLLGVVFIHPTFAQTTADTDSVSAIKAFLKGTIAICSWAWVVLAILAGKLMTNDFVYGSFLHLDIYLRKVWNIIKNFANFGLVAIVLRSIINNLLKKEGDLKKIITNTLIAGILIQASRFLVGAILDVSTIATVAVSGFPSTFIASDQKTKENMEENIKNFKKQRIKFNLNASPEEKMVDTLKPIGNTSNQTQEDIHKLLLPTYNSISGPFIYLGMGVFQFQDFLATDNVEDLITTTLSYGIKFFFIFFFTIALLLLFIANIMRIGLLWVFIIGSPFLILFAVFKPKLGESSGGGGIGKLLTLPNFLAIAFKPVIFVAFISLMLIMVVSIEKTMKNSAAQFNNINGVIFTANDDNTKATMDVEGISEVTIRENSLFANTADTTQTIFAVLIQFFLIIFLMRWMIKLSLTIGGGPIEKTMEGLLKKAETIAKSLPILPIAGGASLNATKMMAERQKKDLLGGFGMDTSGKFSKAERAFEQKVSDWMGMDMAWSTEDYNELEGYINSPDRFFIHTRDLAAKRLGGLSISGNSSWKGKLEDLLQKYPTYEGLRKAGDGGDSLFDNYFKDEGNNNTTTTKKNRLILHKLLGRNNADNNTKEFNENTPISYDELMNNVYYSKTNQRTPAATNTPPPEGNGEAE